MNFFGTAEFGFVVMGHEFDSYTKKMIRDIKNWDWFIDEPGEEESEDDEVGVSKRKGGGRRKRKKSGEVENDDDEWTGESDEDKEVLAKSSKVKKPKYLTRSKSSDKHTKAVTIRSNSPQIDDEGEDEDDNDETLGGFIVDEDSAGEELEIDDEEEEELKEEDDEEE